MDSAELLRFLVRAGEALGCAEVALRCDCENLETVYVVERAGQLMVTDRGETFSDLERFNETYRQLDVQQARDICQRYRVTIDDHDPEQYPRIGKPITDDDPQLAIRALADAVDAVFAAASRY